MSKNTTKVLRFLRLTGYDGDLSLTNIALMVVLGRMCFSDSTGLTEVLPFLITAVGYQAKRWQAAGASPSQDTKAVQDAIADLQSKITALHIGKQFGK